MRTTGNQGQSNADGSSSTVNSKANVKPNRVTVANWPARGSVTQKPKPTEAMTSESNAPVTTGRKGCVTDSHPDHKATMVMMLMKTTDNTIEAKAPSTNLVR